MSETQGLTVLHRDDLPRGGFAGVREHRLVTDPRLFGPIPAPVTGAAPWSGLGSFVYLADARFIPRGETGMHPHKEIDVISVMVEGRIAHEGSLQHGQELNAGDVQVQRAGGEGFVHNEVNPDQEENRMIQLWALPEAAGQPAGYRCYRPGPSGATRIYGGNDDRRETFASRTDIEIALLEAGGSLESDRPFVAYLTRGAGEANGVRVSDGDLFRGERLIFAAGEPVQLILVKEMP